MRPVPQHRQRGIAVVTALLLTTLAITIVASLFWQQQVQVRSIENQRLQLQKQWILRGALDWASLILREDAKYSNIDSLDEPWATPLAETRLDQYVENGRADDSIADAALSGSISDAQARYNLTNLSQNGITDPAEVAIFAQLLENVQVDTALAQATADAMAAAYRPPGSSAATIPQTGAANDGSQPTPQPMNLVHVEDLLAVPGFSPEAFDRLKNFVIFLPSAAPVNANTAPVEVLAARVGSHALAASLVAGRKAASFRDVADLAQRFPGAAPAVSASDVSVSTHFFLVDGKVRISRAGLDVQALIERNGANTKVVWIREY
ncbi:MAG: general secretion pathway protein GspK [Gallionellales bacterium RIFCSPLOWO2_12_FULL_59_22]|nr:MAG: general secretion pathway protein GspK [Gallionellales bacterium RIFCSPLOWO2_02_FULL_59_110]OGT03761.1 MAG: general secretion pathway protein GspK [Gallionellales bacterium RIFCSPLOWO2_02_58_13]OGT14717.1 MAG: general secretion pathway protein GspK [Gallionellales bacterium RIFCSPLOWO2_12_FULL_59_22]